jgi:hypothetical protein
MIETWQQKWSKASGYDTRDGCMLSEIEELRKANAELIKELWRCHDHSIDEQDESSIEVTIETYQSAPN